MPASTSPLFLGHVYGHAHGRSATHLGTLEAVWRDARWTYTATADDEQQTEHDSHESAIEALALPDPSYYSFSIERTFFKPDKIPAGRKIVTTRPV